MKEKSKVKIICATISAISGLVVGVITGWGGKSWQQNNYIKSNVVNVSGGINTVIINDEKV